MIDKRKFAIRKPTKSDIGIVIFLIIYRIFLDQIYIKYIHPNYAYYHFELNFDVYYFIISYIYMVAMACFVPKLLYRKKMADLIIVLLIIMYFIPYTTLLCYCSHYIYYSIFVFVYFLLLVFLNNIINLDNIKIKLNINKKVSINWFRIMIIFCGLIVIFVSGKYANFRVSFDLSEYYEYRAMARENEMPEVLKYLYNWAIVALDIGLAYCLINKKKLLLMFVLFVNILAFSYNGKKSVLFILLVIIAVSLMLKDKHIKKIPFTFLGLVFLGYTEMLIRGGESFIAKYFIRRMLFVPPFIGGIYYDYFSTNELDYLRSSVLRRFGSVSPYGNIPRFIGETYFSNIGILAMNANTGLCGDAFSNFGYYSLLIVPIVIVITFKIIEACAKDIDYRIQVVVAIWMAYTFVSGAYFTLLLTDGVIFLGVLLKALSSENKINNIETLSKDNSLLNTNNELSDSIFNKNY